MKVYVGAVSGNSYKVRILLSLLEIPHELVVLDMAGGAHRKPDFVALNPRGEVPVLEDGGRVIWDSAACLVYLGRKFGGDAWVPSDAGDLAEVMQWLALAATELQVGLQYGRRGLLQGRWTAGTLEQNQAMARVGLSAMERRLADNAWLALDRPTVADVACFPYTETAPESKMPLEEWPAVSAWLDRCRATPGWPGR